MDGKEYVKKALVVERGDYQQVADRIGAHQARIIHAVMGVSTEGGELLDAVKKSLFYGTSLDSVNIKEEIGDVCWYLAILLDELGLTFEDAMETNINKLVKRYEGGFSEEQAVNRDLRTERKILEGKEKTN